jgi:transmembrane sensor
MTWHFKRRATTDVATVAARWVLRLDEGQLPSTQRAEFERWLSATPEHRAALERAASALETATRHTAAPEVMQMREAALNASGRPRSTSWALAASVAGVGVIVAALWVAQRHDLPAPQRSVAVVPTAVAPPTHYATEVGERATISLPDGSTATLDTQSELDVAFTATERAIRLLRGQALFEVAKHKELPFLVYAGGRRITAVGTTFNVRLDGQRLRVALIEGKIRVAAQLPHGTPGNLTEQVTMSPGEVLDTTQVALMSVKVADVARTTTWREGVSTFVDAPLADVVAEMNRYINTPILIEDRTTGALRISGVFKTGDPERFAEAVAKVFPLSIDHDAAGSVVLRTLSAQK